MNARLDAELKDVTRNCAAASRVMCADAAAARLTPTRTLTIAPQKAPRAPSAAAAVAMTHPRPRTSAAIAAYETASAPSAAIESEPET